MNLLIFSILILIIMGTKFINYYYKFFYMYKQLNNYEKIKYFSNNSLVKIICQNLKIKTFFSVYILSPLIKINYLIITTLIYLLCALCDKQLDDILLQNGFNNLNDSNVYEESPIINFTENSELQKLNEKINSSDDSPTSLKTDVDFFMNTLKNVQDNFSPKNIQENIFSPKNIQENIFLFDANEDMKIKDVNKLDKLIDFQIVTPEINEETKNSNNNQNENDNLNDFLIEEIYDKFENEEIYDKFENEEIKDFIIKNKEEEKINKINEIHEIHEINETISIEEVDFGDYVNNLINKDSERNENKVSGDYDENNEKIKKINNMFPTKIKIGKKRK